MASDEPTETPVPADDAEDGPPEGVFGNLPRDAARAAQPPPGRASRSPGGEEPRGQRGRGQAPKQNPDVSLSRARCPIRTGRDHAGGGVEDVAWAGVAAAAEAATIGVRLATRALEAMRDAVDRR